MRSKVRVKARGTSAKVTRKMTLTPRKRELAMIGALKPVRNLAQKLAPHLNGVLKSSISVIAWTRGGKTSGRVGTNSPYARRREFGFYGQDKLGRTYADAPTPYLWPAWIAKRATSKRQLVKAIKRLWK